MAAKNEHGLTPQQEKFAQAVASGKSLSDAYRASYKVGKSKPETVNENASRVMSDGKVSARVRALQAAAADLAVLDGAEILREIRRLALSDIGGIMKDGKMLLPNEMDVATRAAVSSFEMDEYGRIKYRFHDKNAALEKAAKHLGLYERDNKQKVNPLAELLAALPGDVFGPMPSAARPSDDDDADE